MNNCSELLPILQDQPRHLHYRQLMEIADSSYQSRKLFEKEQANLDAALRSQDDYGYHSTICLVAEKNSFRLVSK